MSQAKHKTEAQLTGWQAFRDAWQRRPMEHFPHREQSSEPANVSTREIVELIDDALKNLGPGLVEYDDALEALVERSRESLDEVKAQTEYQDQKSTRLLTVATFFVALSGLLINAFAQDHSVRIVWGGSVDWWQVLAVPVYLGFAVFVLSVIVGALVTFHATQTRFRYEEATAIKPNAPPASQIFFRAIVRTDPTEWARSFTQTDGASAVPAKDLSLRYAKNYILETYLVAAKVADKMRYLEAAQAILASSLKILLLWLAALAVVSIAHPGDPKEDQPIKVEVVSIPSAAPASYALPSTPPAPAAAKKQDEVRAGAEAAKERPRDK